MIIKPNPHFGKRHHLFEIVVHSMGEYIKDDDGKIYHASDYLADIKRLSAHFLVQSNGDVMQCVEPYFTARHALGLNTGRIGIEVLVEGEHNYGTFLRRIKEDWVKPIQMKNTIILINNLCEQYKIKSIKRHSDIDPKRKFDPGKGFDWAYLLENVKL